MSGIRTIRQPPPAGGEGKRSSPDRPQPAAEDAAEGGRGERAGGPLASRILPAGEIREHAVSGLREIPAALGAVSQGITTVIGVQDGGSDFP